MKNRQGIVWAPVLIMVAAIVVAAVAGFYMFQASKPASKNQNVAVVNQADNNVNANINSLTNTSTVSNTNTSEDETNNWKKYENSTYGGSPAYSIKYPSDWRVSDFDPQYVRIVPPNGDNANRETASPSLSIDFIVVPGSIPVKTITDPHDVSIGGRSATQGVIEGIPNVFATQVSVNGGILQFSWTKVNEFESTLMLMLNTVSFLDPTAGWKTYTNTTYGYTMKYPTDYVPSAPSSKVYEFEKGQLNGNPYYRVSVYVYTDPIQGGSAGQDTYTWAKNGFPTDPDVAKFHENLHQVTLNGMTFWASDGDTGSTAIPEYMIFHDNRLYVLQDYRTVDKSVATNYTILSTFQFTN